MRREAGGGGRRRDPAVGEAFTHKASLFVSNGVVAARRAPREAMRRLGADKSQGPGGIMLGAAAGCSSCGAA